jgi:hypothetical protein
MTNEQLHTTAGAKAFLRERVLSSLRMTLGVSAVGIGLVLVVQFVSTYLDVGLRSPLDLGDVVVTTRRFGRSGGPMYFYDSLLLSTGFLVILFGTISAWFVGRRALFAMRLGRVLARAAQLDGTITATRTTDFERGGVQRSKLHVTVATSDGRTVTASVEEPIGTALPNVPVQSRATVWLAASGVVVAAGDAVLEGALAPGQ